jgi:hypothetical protein
MTVYVDDMLMEATVGRLTSRWSHMMADSTDELVAFAKRLGLRPAWIQHPGTWEEHFDLTEGKRLQAIGLGAMAIECGGDKWREITDAARERCGQSRLKKSADELRP